MTPKGIYNNCDSYRYDLHRLQDLEDLSLDFVKVIKNQAQKIACLVHQNFLIRREEGWGFTDDAPTLADQ
jgi:hypothetical protein